MGAKVQKKMRQNIRKALAVNEKARRERIGKTMDGIAKLKFMDRLKLAWMIVFKKANG